MKQQINQLRGSLLLLLTSMIWGAAFVAQSAGMDYIGPFTFNGLRMLMGAAVLLPFLLKRRTGAHTDASERKMLLRGGILCGVALFVGSTLQQIGIVDTTAGKAGFITAMYVVLVPVMGVFVGHKQPWLVWLGVALSAVGMYFLCVHESLSLNRGDLMVLAGAVGFSFHILLIDRYSAHVDGVKLSCLQFFVAGVLGLVFMFLFETPQISQIFAAWLPLLYAGVFSCGVAYTLQILGQRDTDPTIASMILCLEAVFSVVFSWFLLGERLSAREIFGCVLIFAAILLAQLKGKAGDPETNPSV